MDPMDEIRETFFQECEELLEALESGLLSLSEGTGDDETVNAMFRAVHSVKGGAGAFGLEALVRFAHRYETTLDEARAGRLTLESNAVKVFLRAFDVLSDLVAAARDGSSEDDPRADAVIAELEALTGEDGASAPSAGEASESADDSNEDDFTPMMIDLGLPGGDDEARRVYVIEFEPKPALYANGNETTLLFRSLADLGDLETTCDATGAPALDEFAPGGAYLKWTLRLTTDEDEDAVREVFEFVEGDCALTIEEDLSSAPTADIGPDGEDDFVPTPIEAFDDAPAAARGDEPQTADTSASPQASATPPPQTENARAAAARDAAAPKATIRVDLERVDRLINLVGELVINQSMLVQGVEEAGLAGESAVSSGLDELQQLTRDIQESVMAIRAQPVKPLFQRMQRIVREAAAATDKNVRLQTEGEWTEVDKTVVERLADPLTHMIRNAVDHGLEKPEARAEAGKDAEGVVRLSAAHRSGRVMIEVADDGAGINRPRVKQIAIDKGLIPDDVQLTDTEIDNLLFMPGFSTAKEVSDLSGRGVGMDVVKKSIQALGGRISITSNPGRGSVFTISLPLTLAVLDGMVVRVADETLVLPLTAIVETLKPQPDAVHPMGDEAQVAFVRGEFLPIVDVGCELGFRMEPVGVDACVFILIETEDGYRCALAVDSIHDQRQVVIKGLEENYGEVPGVAAATILGDGRIALILDPDNLTESRRAARMVA